MKKYKGFTLAEVLIMLVIIGVIATLSITVVSTQKAKFGLNCYYLLRELQLTAGSLAARTDDGTLTSKVSEQTETTDEDGNTTTEETTKYDLSSDSEFCKFLANSLNSASVLKCADGDLFNATISNIYNGISASSTPNFRLINKYSIYLSKHVAGGTTAAGEVKPGYRMIAVDLNGDGKPNQTDDDIITFAMFDNGAVLPYGVAATNTRTDKNGKTEYVQYFQTVIKGKNLVPNQVVLQESGFLKRLEKSSVAWMFPSVILKNPDNVSEAGIPRNLSFKDGYCKVYADEVAWYDSSYCTGYTSITKDWILKLQTNLTQDSSDETPTEVTEVMRDYSVSKCGKYCGEDGSSCVDDADTWYLNNPDKEPVAIIDCSFNIIKPQMSKFIPILQDVYTAHYGTDNENTTVNHAIYKF